MEDKRWKNSYLTVNSLTGITFKTKRFVNGKQKGVEYPETQYVKIPVGDHSTAKKREAAIKKAKIKDFVFYYINREDEFFQSSAITKKQHEKELKSE